LEYWSGGSGVVVDFAAGGFGEEVYRFSEQGPGQGSNELKARL
jgi:hypothetical protein